MFRNYQIVTDKIVSLGASRGIGYKKQLLCIYLKKNKNNLLLAYSRNLTHELQEYANSK